MESKIRKIIKITIFLFIAFFSIATICNAASFAYEDFNWEEFSDINNNYWANLCKEEDKECYDKVLDTKKRFYTRLYEMLAKVKREYGFIDDNIIIATVFYSLSGESFSDPDTEGTLNAYRIDDDASSISKDKYIGTFDEGSYEYFKKETDSLKTLVNAFIGYKSICYGVTSNVPSTDSNNNTGCPNGEIVRGNKCLVIINDSIKSTFFDMLGLSFSSNSTKYKCATQAKEKGYNTSIVDTSTTKVIDESFFWDFLENTNYLDKKKHLKRYYVSVIAKTDHKEMEEFTEDEYIQHEEELIKVRKLIIKGIKEVLEYFEGISAQYNTATNTIYWWPIGSDTTTENNGKIMAIDVPSSVNVTSKYGLRTHPTSGEANSMHHGVDIAGNNGQTNVISVNNGTIESVTNGCVAGNTACGGGYGNHIVIKHGDGNYTLYAHLYENSIIVNEGDVVEKGQVIAKVGNTGNSTGAHLHFEVRIGSNNNDSTQDPMLYINLTNPRSAANDSNSEFVKMLHYFEGSCSAKENNGNYVVHDDGYGIPTVGYGIALKYNIDRFKSYGIDVTNLSFGAEIAKEIVDKVEQDEVNENVNSVKSIISKSGITLEESQIDSLVMVTYQFGNIGNISSMYKTYGNSDSLKDTVKSSGGRPWFYFKENPSTGNGRAEATWKLFHEGKYTYSDNC